MGEWHILLTFFYKKQDNLQVNRLSGCVVIWFV